MPAPLITIQTTHGREAVRAEVFGPLAVHLGVNGHRLYNVTHVTTGKVIVRDVTKAHALRFVEHVKGWGWNAPEPILKLKKHVVENAVEETRYGTSHA